MIQIAHEETCFLDHKRQDLVEVLECSISHSAAFLMRATEDLYSIRHNLSRLSFPLLPADLSTDLLSGAALSTKFFDDLELGALRVVYISIESEVNGHQIVQKVGPFNSLSEIADSNLKRDFMSQSGRCALVFRIETHGQSLPSDSDLPIFEDKFSYSDEIGMLGEEARERDVFFEQSLDGSLESLCSHLQSTLDKALVDLSAAQIGAENYRYLFESQRLTNAALQSKLTEIKSSASWKFSAPIRVLHRALNKLKKAFT